MKILHLITSLDQGGAQSILADLLEHWEDARDRHLVVSMRPLDGIPDYFRSRQFLVKSLGMQPGRILPGNFRDLIQILRAYQPDLIQTWLYHADLLGSLAAWFCGKVPVVWGVHHTTTGRASVKRSTWRILGILKILARYSPARIICCSHSAYRTHRDLGYPEGKLATILNGIDTGKFAPDPEAGGVLRRDLGLTGEVRLVGMFARYDPQKDHLTYLHAAAAALERLPDVHFLLAGKGVSPSNERLRAEARRLGIEDNLHLLGNRKDMPLLNAGIDLATLSSAYGEALPLSLCEAMSCGVPAVGTEIGDIAELIDGAGKVVEPGDPQALAQAWLGILELPAAEYQKLSLLARSRVVKLYNISRMVQMYQEVYQQVLR